MSVRLKLFAVIALTIAAAALVMAHVNGVNGPSYWRWPWRRLTTFPLYGWMTAAALPFFVGQFIYGNGILRRRLALALVTVSALALELAAIATQPPGGLRRAVIIVENAGNTSYFTAAKLLYQQPNISVSQWLEIFPNVVPMLMIHARYKPRD